MNNSALKTFSPCVNLLAVDCDAHRIQHAVLLNVGVGVADRVPLHLPNGVAEQRGRAHSQNQQHGRTVHGDGVSTGLGRLHPRSGADAECLEATQER